MLFGFMSLEVGPTCKRTVNHFKSFRQCESNQGSPIRVIGAPETVSESEILGNFARKKRQNSNDDYLSRTARCYPRHSSELWVFEVILRFHKCHLLNGQCLSNEVDFALTQSFKLFAISCLHTIGTSDFTSPPNGQTLIDWLAGPILMKSHRISRQKLIQAKLFSIWSPDLLLLSICCQQILAASDERASFVWLQREKESKKRDSKRERLKKEIDRKTKNQKFNLIAIDGRELDCCLRFALRIWIVPWEGASQSVWKFQDSKAWKSFTSESHQSWSKSYYCIIKLERRREIVKKLTKQFTNSLNLELSRRSGWTLITSRNSIFSKVQNCFCSL